MGKVEQILIKHSKSKSIWTLTLEEKQELTEAISNELFKVIPSIEPLIFRSFSTSCYSFKQGHLNKDNVLFEFVNYLLGKLFDENPELFLSIREQVNKSIPDRALYNNSTLDLKLAQKYFPDYQAEYDFIFDNDLSGKKIV